MTDKIAIMTSSGGNDAINITEFFSEGNRIVTDCLLTDSLSPKASAALAEYGVEILYFPEETWQRDADVIADTLRSRGVSLIVVDDFEEPIPVALIESYPGALLVRNSETLPDGGKTYNICALSPEGENKIMEAPLELSENLWPRAIVEALQNLSDHRDVPPVPVGDETPPPLSPEEEWAEALHIPYEPLPPEIPHDEHVNEIPGNKGINPAGFNAEVRHVSQQNVDPMPPTYLVWSIISLILCCFVPSVVAVFYSARVSTLYFSGNLEGARKASRKAEIWIIISVVLGLISTTFSLPLSLL